MNIRVLLLTLLFFGAGRIAVAQTIWTGSVSTAWNTAGNWTAGVPDASDDVTIPNVTNDPVISAAGAVAKSVTVQTGGILTINATGTLTLNGSTSQAMLNNGTVQNNGTITITSVASPGVNGILNNSIFNNNAGSNLIIDGLDNTLQSYSLSNGAGGTFTNTGIIKLGATTSPGKYGVYNGGTFNNNTGGQINIDRVQAYGISNAAPFTNAGIITIGALTSGTTMTTGIVNSSNSIGFTNAAGGQINIDRVTAAAISANNISTFSNSGTITIGAGSTIATLIDGT